MVKGVGVFRRMLTTWSRCGVDTATKFRDREWGNVNVDEVLVPGVGCHVSTKFCGRGGGAHTEGARLRRKVSGRV